MLLDSATPSLKLSPQDAAQALLDRRHARQRLIDFACYVDPLQASQYQAQHLKRIAEVLERVERGDGKRVIIAVPRRHWKSSLCSEKLPAWWLGRRNKDGVIVASYALSLAQKFSKRVREMITLNERYRALFPETQIQRDSAAADDWLLETGYRTSFRAVGTGGGIAGHGAQLEIIDDASDPNKALSEVQAENDWEWYKNVIRPCLERDGAIVIVNNRVGLNDLTGHLLDVERNDSADPPEDWEYIKIPAYDKGTQTYLWEDRFGREYYQKLEIDPALWRVQYMQEPTIAEGTEIKREWFEYVPNLPEGTEEQCRVVDTAFTKKKADKADPDFTASMGSAMAKGWLFLLEPFKFRKEMPDTVDWIANEKKLKPRVRFGMAKAAGETIAKQFLARLAVPTEDLEAESVDIRVRLIAFISFSSRGLVKLVCSPEEYSRWQRDREYTPPRWQAFMDEATAFPNGKHDDLLACGAGLTQMHGLRVTVHLPPPKRRNPYAFLD